VSTPKVTTEQLAENIAAKREARASVALDGETQCVEQAEAYRVPTVSNSDPIEALIPYYAPPSWVGEMNSVRANLADATARIVELEAALAGAFSLLRDADWASLNICIGCDGPKRPGSNAALHRPGCRLAALLARHPQAKP